VCVEPDAAGHRRRAGGVAALAVAPPQPDPGELADCVCAGPASLPLVALVRVAGSRWRVEGAFQAGKGCAAWTSTRAAAGAAGIGG
jgi:hypothetical protein